MIQPLDIFKKERFPGREEKESFVNSDVFVNDRDYFDEHKHVVGSFQWRVNRDGVSLSGLL